MKRTDIGVVAFFYLVSAYFYSQTVKLPASSQTYPRFTVTLVFGLTTLYLVQMIVRAVKNGTESGKEDFKDFQAVQFIVCFCATIVYLVLIHFFGFYIATAVFMVAVLLFLRVKPLATLISVVVIMALIYFAFQKFLGVRLPVGEVIKSLK
ncbi:MAG: tripartite tricarboxylate transporter TctB family protein [Eubacteriales bacterium]|nr:tripartite tricarboxylate transporter TctB family protein [Eubacteriales bacterium]